MTPPYAIIAHQHAQDIVREARLTIEAMNAAREMEAEADESIFLEGFDDQPDWVQDGDR